MIEQLVAKVFEARNAAHLEHWATTNGEVHRATGDFYESIISTLDELVECYQGAFDVIGEVKPEVSKDKLMTLLEEQSVWMSENRDEICRDLSVLENLLDELMASYLRTLFKLRRLK